MEQRELEAKVVITTPLELQSIVMDAIIAILKHQNNLSPLSVSTTEVVTAKKLRERLGICSASENNYVQQGILKPKKLGKRVYYVWEEVIATLSSQSDDLLPPKLRGKNKTSSSQKTA